MKRTLLVALLALLMTSCGGFDEDPADEYVGIYKVTVYSKVKWGGDEGAFVDHGTLYVTKVTTNKVKISGFFATNATISSHWISFEDAHTSDSDGYFDEQFTPAYLENNVMQFTSLATGKLKYNGTLYPWKCLSEYTAVKQQ